MLVTKKSKENIYVETNNKKKINAYDINNVETRERWKHWITFYRRNIHRFAEDYLGLKLNLFQKIILYLMGTNNVLAWVASRAVGKSWLTAVFICCYCILYPNAKVVIVASKIGQAGLIISAKIEKELMSYCPILYKEIKKIKTNQNEYEVIFKSGAYCKVVPASEKARGERSNVLIFEEFRMIDKEIVDTVIIPFNMSRKPKYMDLDKYKNIGLEKSKKIYISSAYWKNNWMWNFIKETATNMVNGKKECVVALDLYTALFHKLKTGEEIFGEKSKMEDSSYRMEYENQMLGESDSAYFRLDDLTLNRRNKIPFYPFEKEDLINNKHMENPYGKVRKKNVLKVISVDFATRAGKNNDNTIITCFEAIVRDYGYERNPLYIESNNGEIISKQAIRVKQIYYEFGADYCVIDLANAGIALYEELGKEQLDPETGEHYPAWTIIKNFSMHVISKDSFDELMTKTVGDNPVECIFPITAGAKLNNDIAVDFKKRLTSNQINLLVDEQVGRDILMRDKKYRDGNNEYQVSKLVPYKQTSELIFECVNLEMQIVSGNIKLIEPSNGRKDRYSSMSYGNYFISIKEREILKSGKENYSAINFIKEMNKRSNKNSVAKKLFTFR